MTALETALAAVEKGLKAGDDALEYMPYGSSGLDAELVAAKEALQVLRDLCYGNEALIEKLQEELAASTSEEGVVLLTSSAYDDGYSEGYDEGYNDCNEGYDEGYDVGYADGYDEGRAEGYDEGYDEDA